MTVYKTDDGDRTLKIKEYGEEWMGMWSRVRNWSGVDRILITMVGAVVFLLTAPPVVSVSVAGVPHSRAGSAVNQLPRAVRQPATAEELKQQTEILVGLQVSQSSLEKETADFHTAIQRRMNQLTAEVEDSRNYTLQMLQQTNRRIDSTQRWLKFIVLLFVLSLAGLLYFVRQLPTHQDNPIEWKGRVPEMSPEEERIVAWQSGGPANGTSRKLDSQFPPLR